MEYPKKRLNEVWQKQKNLNDLVIREKRKFTEIEQMRWNSLEQEWNRAHQEWENSPAGPVLKPEPDPDPNKPNSRNIEKGDTMRFRFIQNQEGNEYRFDESGTSIRDAYNRYLRYGNQGVNLEELRALQVDSDTKGGFLVTPVEVAKQIIHELDNRLWTRQLASLITLEKAESISYPYLGTDFGDPTWTGEITESDLDDEMDFEARNLFPHPLRRGIKVSNKLLRLSESNPENFVNERMQYKIRTVQENAFLNGTGSNQPLGMFTVSNSGIGTDRDIATGNLATSIKFDGLKNAIGHLKAPYRENAVWVFHRELETQLSKLKNGEGDYVWKDAQVRGGRPTLLGYPVYLSEYAPHDFSASQYVGIFGDLSFYFIVDTLRIEVQKLVEKYALSDQSAFLIRAECDGAPCVSEAFVRIKLAS